MMCPLCSSVADLPSFSSSVHSEKSADGGSGKRNRVEAREDTSDEDAVAVVRRRDGREGGREGGRWREREGVSRHEEFSWIIPFHGSPMCPFCATLLLPI